MKKTTRKPRASRKIKYDTSEFDKEFVADTFHELGPEDRARWKQIQRKLGRPKQGKGAKVVAVSIEQGLLERSDKLAQKMGLTRAALVARGLRAVLAAEGADVA